MKIPKITAYMRENGARYLGQVNGQFFGVPIKTRIFIDKNGEPLAKLRTLTFHLQDDKVQYKSFLETVNGMEKCTSRIIDFIKLKNFKGKQNVKFPYRIDSTTEYGTGGVKKSFFFIKDGVSFEKTDKDGLMIYKKDRNFKTDRVGFTQGTFE